MPRREPPNDDDPALEARIKRLLEKHLRQMEARGRAVDANETPSNLGEARLLLRRGVAASPLSVLEEAMETVFPNEPQSRPEWKAMITSYDHDELCGIRFASEMDRDQATERLWDRTSHLYSAPFDIVDGRTLLLPLDAVPYLEGLAFEIVKVKPPSSLTDEQLTKVRREQGHH